MTEKTIEIETIDSVEGRTVDQKINLLFKWCAMVNIDIKSMDVVVDGTPFVIDDITHSPSKAGGEEE